MCPGRDVLLFPFLSSKAQTVLTACCGRCCDVLPRSLLRNEELFLQPLEDSPQLSAFFGDYIGWRELSCPVPYLLTKTACNKWSKLKYEDCLLTLTKNNFKWHWFLFLLGLQTFIHSFIYFLKIFIFCKYLFSIVIDPFF